MVTIIDYEGAFNSTVQFDDGTVVMGIAYQTIVEGTVRNPNMPFVCGIGFEGQGRHQLSNNGKMTKMTTVWRSIFARCYNTKQRVWNSTYKDSKICKEWENFQNFGDWFEENYIEGFYLDKDILIKGNKIYSPETCCFVPNCINIIFANRRERGDYPVGVHKQGNKFVAQLNIFGERKAVGRFDTPEEAFECYKLNKENYIKEVADKWQDKISEKVYKAMRNYQIEITD